MTKIKASVVYVYCFGCGRYRLPENFRPDYSGGANHSWACHCFACEAEADGLYLPNNHPDRP